ncbi:MAG: hypothetical protein V3S08_02655 [Phycisphaerales bacterium]
MKTVDIELVALELISVSPINLVGFTTGDDGGGLGLPGDFGFGSLDFPGFDPFPFSTFDFDIEFSVTDPDVVFIELVQLSLVSEDPTGFGIEYEFFETIFELPHFTMFDFAIPDGQPLAITDATVTPTGIGTFDLHVEMETLDLLNSDLPILNFTRTGAPPCVRPKVARNKGSTVGSLQKGRIAPFVGTTGRILHDGEAHACPPAGRQAAHVRAT